VACPAIEAAFASLTASFNSTFGDKATDSSSPWEMLAPPPLSLVRSQPKKHARDESKTYESLSTYPPPSGPERRESLSTIGEKEYHDTKRFPTRSRPKALGHHQVRPYDSSTEQAPTRESDPATSHVVASASGSDISNSGVFQLQGSPSGIAPRSRQSDGAESQNDSISSSMQPGKGENRRDSRP